MNAQLSFFPPFSAFQLFSQNLMQIIRHFIRCAIVFSALCLCIQMSPWPVDKTLSAVSLHALASLCAVCTLFALRACDPTQWLNLVQECHDFAEYLRKTNVLETLLRPCHESSFALFLRRFPNIRNKTRLPHFYHEDLQPEEIVFSKKVTPRHVSFQEPTIESQRTEAAERSQLSR